MISHPSRINLAGKISSQSGVDVARALMVGGEMREVGTDGISTEWVAQSKDKQLERKES